MLTNNKLRIILNEYITNNNYNLIEVSKKINIGYHTLQKFIKHKRNLGLENYFKVYNFLKIKNKIK